MSAASGATRNLEETTRQHANERQPLLKSLPASTTGSLCVTTVIASLVLGWCLLDCWQRNLNGNLFNLTTAYADLTRFVENQSVSSSMQPFAFPLTLAFVEFVFMGVFFTVLYTCLAKDRRTSGATSFANKSWAVLVVSHVSGTFWLQALMMPSQMMSLGAFAMSRAADIPMVAIMRAQAFGTPFGKRTIQTTCLTFAAACTMFYSYAQLAGCVCIWSGSGVALTGLAFWIVYFLILALPAASCVCQEALVVQCEFHSLTVLALQNLVASLLFVPAMLGAHLMGWEDIGEGFKVIFGVGPIFMIVLWLSVAMAATEAASILLIQVADSFWAVALRALRVPIWGGHMLFLHYLGSPLPLSISCPHSSLWSFLMFCGVGLALASICTDKRYEDRPAFSATSKSSAGATPSKA